MDKRIDLSVKAEHIDEILDRVLSKTSLTYKILDNQIVVYRMRQKLPLLQMQQQTVMQHNRRGNQRPHHHS